MRGPYGGFLYDLASHFLIVDRLDRRRGLLTEDLFPSALDDRHHRRVLNSSIHGDCVEVLLEGLNMSHDRPEGILERCSFEQRDAVQETIPRFLRMLPPRFPHSQFVCGATSFARNPEASQDDHEGFHATHTERHRDSTSPMPRVDPSIDSNAIEGHRRAFGHRESSRPSKTSGLGRAAAQILRFRRLSHLLSGGPRHTQGRRPHDWSHTRLGRPP